MAYYYYKEFSKVELHYWLKHGLHSMDAIIQNECERQFLNLLLEIATTFSTEISIDTEAIKEGGLRRFYDVMSREENRNATITTAVVTAIAISILVTPISTGLAKLVDNAIEKIFEDPELIKRQDEKDRLELIKLRQDITLDSLRISQNLEIEKRRSTFYQQLEASNNVEKISLVLNNEKNNTISEAVVDRSEFKEMITLEAIDQMKSIPILKPIGELNNYLIENSIQEIQNANIEIISPDFSSESNKWKGIYEGKVITFKVGSQEFKDLVQSGNIQFKKGSIINSVLNIQRKGQRAKRYEVIRVNKYLD